MVLELEMPVITLKYYQDPNYFSINKAIVACYILHIDTFHIDATKLL